MRKTGARLIGAALLAAAVLPTSAADAESYWQCVPFARMVSGIDLFGRAASWWHQAVGRYEQGSLPRAGAVLVFRAISSMRSGHVATVSRVISERVIEVAHANWSIIHGHRGQIERNVRIVDVSPANDWSRVRVWWAPTQDFGTTDYPTYGFIYGGAAPSSILPAAPVMASFTAKSIISTLLGRLPLDKPVGSRSYAAQLNLLSYHASGAGVQAKLVTLSPPQLVARASPMTAALPAADRRETVAATAAPAMPVKALLVSSPPVAVPAAPKLALN